MLPSAQHLRSKSREGQLKLQRSVAAATLSTTRARWATPTTTLTSTTLTSTTAAALPAAPTIPTAPTIPIARTARTRSVPTLGPRPHLEPRPHLDANGLRPARPLPARARAVAHRGFIALPANKPWSTTTTSGNGGGDGSGGRGRGNSNRWKNRRLFCTATSATGGGEEHGHGTDSATASGKGGSGSGGGGGGDSSGSGGDDKEIEGGEEERGAKNKKKAAARERKASRKKKDTAAEAAANTRGEAEAGAGAGAEASNSVANSGDDSNGADSDNDSAGDSGSGGENSEAVENSANKIKKRNKKSRRYHPFGKPLQTGVTSLSAPGAEFDVEDMMPSPRQVEVDGGDEGYASLTTDGGVGAVGGENPRAMAARPEVIHALSRGLAKGQARDVADNLCTYASTQRTAEQTLRLLEKQLVRRPHQAEWVMPLVRAHLMDEQKPSSESHDEHLHYVREINLKETSLEDMAEKLVRSYARKRWTPGMTRETLQTDYPERWGEAMSLAEKLADRLPVCRHQLLCKMLCDILEAEKTPRRGRVLTELSTLLRGRAHLVLPAIAKFWRVDDISRAVQEEIEESKVDFLQDQALLARWLHKARSKSQWKTEELAGPWSIEEVQELEEASVREAENEKDSEMANATAAPEKGAGEGGGGRGRGEEDEDLKDDERGRLTTAAINVISHALPPEMPELQPTAPLGMFELHLTESPRELNMPPPRDIFGGDTPAGIGEAGMEELPMWCGRDEDATRSMRYGDEYRWPEEIEKEKREEDEEEAKWAEGPWAWAGGGGRGGGQDGGAGAGGDEGRGQDGGGGEEGGMGGGGDGGGREVRLGGEEGEAGWTDGKWERGVRDERLSRARTEDYKGVEEYLLTGKRRKHVPPRVTYQDFEEDLMAVAIKTRLLERSALVAELHPDETRRMQLEMEEQATRTIFVKGFPYGLSTYTIKEAFARCGQVEEVVIKEPTYRIKDGAQPEKTKRRFGPQPHSSFAYSVPHGFVVFGDQEGYRKATVDAFRVFGVNIEGVPVTTSPAQKCRTVYVENREMRTGEDMVEAINKVIQPYYEVMLKTHFLDDEMPQVVAIPFKNHVAARTTEKLLRREGFATCYYYTVPKSHRNPEDKASMFDILGEQNDMFPGGGVSPEDGDNRPPHEIFFDKIKAMSERAKAAKAGRR